MSPPGQDGLGRNPQHSIALHQTRRGKNSDNWLGDQSVRLRKTAEAAESVGRAQSQRWRLHVRRSLPDEANGPCQGLRDKDSGLAFRLVFDCQLAWMSI